MKFQIIIAVKLLNLLKMKGVNINIAETNLERMKQIIGYMKANSSVSNGLNLQTFKLVVVYLSPSLVFLINLLLKKGEFPSRLKEATVIPLRKERVKTDPSNWRPISMLSLFSKLRI